MDYELVSSVTLISSWQPRETSGLLYNPITGVWSGWHNSVEYAVFPAQKGMFRSKDFALYQIKHVNAYEESILRDGDTVTVDRKSYAEASRIAESPKQAELIQKLEQAINGLFDPADPSQAVAQPQPVRVQGLGVTTS